MSFMASYSFVLLFFALALVPSNVADSPAELYWKSKLGSITMPKVLKASLQLGSNNEVVQLNPEFNVGYVNQKDKQYGVYIEYAHNPNSIPHDGQVVWFTNDNLTTAGTKMKLHFNQIENGAKFLPLHIMKSMTNAANKLQTTLNILSLDPKSIAAKYIEQMFKDCGEKGIKDEVRYCATSLEDMVDFITNSRKDKSYMVVSTEQDKNILMEYTIQKAQKIGKDDKSNIVCHRLINPYAVFLCHNIKNTDVYSVSLVGSDKKQMNAIAVCHKDTSDWYPEHIAFQLLNLKPGGKPICHFVSGDTIVWL